MWRIYNGDKDDDDEDDDDNDDDTEGDNDDATEDADENDAEDANAEGEIIKENESGRLISANCFSSESYDPIYGLRLALRAHLLQNNMFKMTSVVR